MKTSKQWWDETKKDKAKLINWLKNQYHGEVTAAERIRSLILCYPSPNPDWVKTVEQIAREEGYHAKWVATILKSKGIDAKKLDKSERYWDEVVPQITDWDTGCAVAAHAEKMRLERIQVICEDEETEPLTRVIFKKILQQELMHEEMFRKFTTDEAMDRTLCGHLSGLNELGLVP